MARVTDISEVATADIQQSLSFIKQLVAGSHPELDTALGGLTNLLLLPSAEHAAANQLDITRYINSSSLKALQANPELADDEIVDVLLSNSGLVRRSGTFSYGTLVVVVSKRLPLTIQAGSKFTAGGYTFVTENTYSVKTSSANIDSATDQVLVARSDGNYRFSIPVIAEVAGSGTALKRGTIAESVSVIANLVTIYVETDFTSGEDAETNTELAARQAEGLAAKTPGNRVECAAFLRDSVYSSYAALSVIGAGDSEMLRDKHTIFPGSFGGRTDWYVRTSNNLQSTKLIKTCVLVEKTSDGYGIWQCVLDRDDAPAFYDIVAIQLPTATDLAGSYTILEDIRDNDLTAIEGELKPDIADSLESAFTRYQTAVIRFKDTDTLTASLSELTSTATYVIHVRGFGDIAGIQSLLSSRHYRGLFGDILVKAPVPCFVSLGFTLFGAADAEQPDVTALKSALVRYINSTQFTGRLFASDLTKVVYDNVPSGISVSNIDMIGRLLAPDGTHQVLHSAAVLEIPFRPAIMVSSRTTAFICTPELIRISAGILNIPDIL